MHQYVEESVLDYASFIGMVIKYVKERMGEEYDIRTYKVVKNNSLELDSLIILKQGKSYAPNIYFMPYYEAYLEGTQVEEIAERICDIYESSLMPLAGESFSYTLEAMKPYIFYRLVSFERNLKLLKDIPHIRWLDLAVTFHCLVRSDEEGIGTIRISNSHMEQWGIECDYLKELAWDNTRRLFPASVKTMEEVLYGFTQSDGESNPQSESNSQGCLRDIYDNPIKQGSSEPTMYVMTNQKGINGASCLMYEDILGSFSDKIGADFFILPSSIHEVLFVPKRGNMKACDLAAMVREINITQVANEEVLSDNIYLYSRENRSISIV